MSSSTKPKILFFLGCIPVRILLAYIAYLLLHSSSSVYKYSLIVATMMIGIGFWTIYLNDWRKTGAETFGQKIWWNSIRPLHGSLYILFAISALLGYKDAWILLAIDVIVGLVAQIVHTYS